MDRPANISTESNVGTAVCDIDALDALLRGEVAAVETYDIVLPRFENQAPAVELQRIRDEHSDAATMLRERVQHFGGDPAEGPDAWGKLATTTTDAANVFGPTMALRALKHSEEYGIGRYENTLSDPNIDDDDKDLIRFRLLPRCRHHVSELSRIIHEMKA